MFVYLHIGVIIIDQAAIALRKNPDTVQWETNAN